VDVTTVCVFCGSKTGDNPVYREATAAFGRLLAERGLGLVYGGGDIGLMGVLADAVMGAGGEVVGVIPEFMLETELGHGGVTRLEVVGSMHDRKARMGTLADAFVGLPGGIGTLEELFEIWTWAQLRLHAKPVGVLNLEGFFDHGIAFVQHMVDEGFVRERTRDLLLVDDDAERLLDRMVAVAAELTAEPARAAEGDGLART
jgi:uncharacterized protein (TIGR00730 family)